MADTEKQVARNNDPAPAGHCNCSLRETGAASHPRTLAESARLMPVTASPLPAHASTYAGPIS